MELITSSEKFEVADLQKIEWKKAFFKDFHRIRIINQISINELFETLNKNQKFELEFQESQFIRVELTLSFPLNSRERFYLEILRGFLPLLRFTNVLETMYIHTVDSLAESKEIIDKEYLDTYLKPFDFLKGLNNEVISSFSKDFCHNETDNQFYEGKNFYKCSTNYKVAKQIEHTVLNVEEKRKIAHECC